MDVDPITFFNHFKELSQFDELDQEITQSEIETVVSNLKRDKSNGTD